MADTIYLKNGDIIDNAVITDVTPTEIKYRIGQRAVVYTIPKSDALRIAYDDGGEDVFDAAAGVSSGSSFPASSYGEPDAAVSNQPTASTAPATIFYTAYSRWYLGYSARGFGAAVFMDWPLVYQLGGGSLSTINVGMGVAWETAIDVSLGLRFKFPLSGDGKSQLSFGGSTTWGLLGAEPIALYAGYSYEKYLLELGYSVGGFYDGEGGSNILFRAGMEFDHIREKNGKEKGSKATDKKRYFRIGLGMAYDLWLSDAELLGAGSDGMPIPSVGYFLFMRLGPEPIYFTTGISLMVDHFRKEGAASTNITVSGINLGRYDLLDIDAGVFNTEIPLLLNYGTGQIRFTGGVLLDFFGNADIKVTVSESVPLIGGQSVIDTNIVSGDSLDILFPDGNMYWVVGMDFDIFKYWGMGAKLLIHNHSFGDYNKNYGYKPSPFQLRFSTYFVF